MTLIFSLIAALCILGGLIAISLTLQEMDRRLEVLAESMEGRYGSWLERSAEERRRIKAAKAEREKQGSTPARPPTLGSGHPAKG